MPSQFWSLTISEFAKQVDGFAWRQENEQWRIAAIVAAIYDVNRDPKRRRKPITAVDIIGKRRQSRRERTPDEQLDDLKRLALVTGGQIVTSESDSNN